MAKSLRRSQSASKRKSSSKSKRRTANSTLNLKSTKAKAKGKKKSNQKDTSFVDIFYEQTWLSEILAVFLFITVTFIAISFLSEFLFSSETQSANLMGAVGNIIAVLVGGFFGWSIFVPLLALTLMAFHLWSISSESDNMLQLEIKSFPLLILGALLLTFSSSSFFSVFFGRVGGGDVGVLISKPLIEYTDATGSILIISGFFILSITCILQKSSKDVFFSTISSLASVTILSSKCLINTMLLSLSLIKPLVKKLSFIEFSKREDDEEVKDVEFKLKPVLRKNKLDEKKWLAKEQTHDVLVSRRKREKTVSISKKKAVVNNAPYVIPASNLLNPHVDEPALEDDEVLKRKSFVIEEKLADFGIKGRVTEVHPGPVITLFEFEPAPGVKVGKIAALQDDLAMSLKAAAIRIIAPLPRKGTVGIEVPNKRRELVTLREIIESESFAKAENPLTIALGKDTYGDPVAIDIATMPHLLIAGATGTGKSVCINTLLLSLLFRSTPDELGLILIDPKILELSVYEGIPHLKVPVVTVPKQARAVLDWAVKEMDRRYRLMQKYGVRSISGYNQLVKGEIALEEEDEVVNEDEAFGVEVKPLGVIEEEAESLIAKEELKPLSKLVIVIDELADLMLSVGKDIEDLIARLAQKARAAGIHLIVATQRPSVDVITGLIKANFPARVSFRVSSRVDSRTILDSMGAEKLLGMGDMLYMLPGFIGAERAHGAFVSDDEVKKVIDKIKKQAPPQYDQEIISVCEKALLEDGSSGVADTVDEEYDELYDRAVEFVMKQGSASTSSLQRAFRIGYNRAARIIDTMEREGVIGPVNGAKPREIIIEGYDYADEE